MLRLLRELEAEQRPATSDEHAVLARWSGWGAVPQVFDPDDDRFGTALTDVRNLIPEDAWHEAQQTVINAHYTDPSVATAMWSALEQMGFAGGRVLEPGCGSGNFIGLAPAGAVMVGVERDPTTARVAQALYPDADIRTGPFQTFNPREPFDAVIGNVPFAKVTPHDPRHNRGKHSLHNYFLIKSLALLRPGGVLVALTSRYTLDAVNPAARRELAELGDLVGALRLPGGAMRAAAGTEAVMDLLVLRRRAPGEAPAPDVPPWDRAVEVMVPDETSDDETFTAVKINRYFADHPHRVLGKTVAGRSMYREGDVLVKGDLSAVGEQVTVGLADIVAASSLRYTPPPPSSLDQPPPQRVQTLGDVELAGPERLVPFREESFVVSKLGTIYRYVGEGSLRQVGDKEVPKRGREELRALVRIRDGVLNLMHLEVSDAPDEEIERARAHLRYDYERYRAKYGPINRVKWARTGRTDPRTGEEKYRRNPPKLGGFRSDPDWPVVSAVEVYDEDLDVASPASIQRQRTIHPPHQRRGADTPEEALAIVLDELGVVDMDRIAELLGVDETEALAQVSDLVFVDPTTGGLVPAETYLSGNVRSKLATARAATESGGDFARNVRALEAVQPPQLEPGKISARPGATWIPTSDVECFVREVFGYEEVEVSHLPQISTWRVTVHGHIDRDLEEWGTGRRRPDDLLEACLNQHLVKVYDTLPDHTRVLNRTETIAARETQERIADRFATWIWEDQERAARLADVYNERFNSYVAPHYTGEHLTFPGLNSAFVPHPHQRAAVARILREGRCLLAHAVGAGKTATMVMAGMEMRRLGLANRPAYVVPNHMLEQFSREFLQLYPMAKVLVTTKDLRGREGRKKFIARCAAGDWDAVVITHKGFEQLPLRAETYTAYTDEALSQLREALESLDEDDRMTRKQIEQRIARVEEKLNAQLDAAGKDDGVCFEESGIDYLFVDELHLFKNKALVTRIEGMSKEGSKRAMDLDAKLWAMRRERGTRILTGATATPVANQISEAWIMQTFLQPDVLAESEVDRFDAWVGNFGQTMASMELAPDGGSYRLVERLARYRNLPELIAQFRRTADVLTRDDLNLALPNIVGGKPEVLVVPPSEELRAYVAELVRRAERIKTGTVDPQSDNMLKITGDGRKAALDLRLVDRMSDPAGGKLEAAAARIAEIVASTQDVTYLDETGAPSPRDGGFVIVFLDLSTPTTDGSWNAYDELRRRLVSHGVPAEAVAYIHDAKNDEDRGKLFARCRSGQIRVLIGSTEKMGVGTNIHTRAAGLVHIDCPWRPADIEQREGRIIRQGNQNPEVHVVRIATGESFDVFMWQTCERKAAFIDQLMRGEVTSREVDDIGDSALSYAEVKALATGNPLVIEQAAVQAELAKLERLEAAHQDSQWRIRRAARSAATDAEDHRAKAAEYAAAIRRRVDTTGDRFRMEIDGDSGVVIHTDRADAGEALLQLARDRIHEVAKKRGTGETRVRTIGRLAGFPVSVFALKFYNTRQEQAVLQARLQVVIGETVRLETRLTPDELQAKSPSGIITGFESRIRGLDNDLANAQQRAAEAEQRAAKAESKVDAPFPEQDRLERLRRRYQEIVDELAPADEEPAAAEQPAQGEQDRARAERQLAGVQHAPEPPGLA